MAGRPSLRAQMSAHRFLLRRLEYAVLGRPMPNRRDPLRAQKFSLVAGCAVATGLLVFDVILGSSRHDRIPGDVAVVMSRQSGALFVRADGRLRPVANLTSARLILGSPVTPHLIDDAALRDVADGPVLGIPGAPRTLGQVIAPPDLRWAVCDDSDGLTTVVVDDGASAALAAHAAAVVTVADGDGAVYLLHDGKRAMIDPADPATARALHLDGVTPRRVSPALLNAIREVPALGPPPIAGRGQPSGIAGLAVGAVVRLNRTDSPEYYVVLAGGLQRVGRLTVDLLRFADTGATLDIPDAPPELVAGSPLLDALPVAEYPDESPPRADSDEELCATWQSGRSDIAIGPPTAESREAVTLAGSDGDGPGIDKVRITPGRALDVLDAGAAVRYLITDSGVRFPVRDSAVAALGLTDTPAQAPSAIIGTLPAGPELVRDAASVGWDVLGSAP